MSGVAPLTFQNFLWQPQNCAQSCPGKCLLVALSILFKIITLGTPYCCSLKGRVKTVVSIPPCNLLPTDNPKISTLSSNHGILTVQESENHANMFYVFNKEFQRWSKYMYQRKLLEARIYYLREDSGYNVAMFDQEMSEKLAERGVIYLQNNQGHIFVIESDYSLRQTTREDIVTEYRLRQA